VLLKVILIKLSPVWFLDLQTATMSQASQQVSRYRPAVIAITGVAAAFGIWTLYSTFSDQSTNTKKPLHRSNAVRRTTRRVSGVDPVIEISSPTPEEPFGAVMIKRNNVPIGRIVFGRDPIPSPPEWQLLYGDHAEHVRARIVSLAVRSVISASQESLEPSDLAGEARLLLSEFGLEFMGSDIINNPVEAAERYRPLLAEMLGFIGTIDLERLFQNFLSDLANEVAETEVGIMDETQAAEPAQGLKGLLYYIAEEKAKREAYEHRGIRCDSCNESPIRGIRWHCLNCPDVDLCSTCEMTFPHQQTHVFVKVKIPLPAVGQPGRTLNYPVWYPGSPHILHEPIQPTLRKRLAEEYHYEEPQIDALYDQFITTANVSFEQDPSQIKIGIDRKAFDSALTIEAWTNRSAPNALYDRMFAFYDRGNKGAILFEDFINGMAYLRGPSRFQPLDRALQGFDIDADGFVDRRDFLLLLRAKYDVQKELIAGASSIRADKISQEGIDVLKSSQPISAIFCEQDMPQGELRSSGGKPRNIHGDLEPAESTKTILDDDEVPAGASAVQNNVFRVRSLPQLQRQLARLDRRLHQQEAENVNIEDEATVEGFSDSLPNTLSEEDAAALGVTSSPDTENVTTSAHHDALWRFTEMSIHEALDPIFKAREKLDREVQATAEERRRWRKEIDGAVEQKKAFEENLRVGAELDPLVATAAHSHDRLSRSWITNQDTQEQRAAEVQREIDIQMRDSILPTDTESLEQFEAEIHEQSLEELLAAAGYSIAEDGDDGEQPSSPATAQTLPSHPNGSSISANEDRPQQERLEHLATLDREERLLGSRGGAGRLSYDELEIMAKTNREVRGLVVSWLELASF
jgi:Ca2+-binding EF-hand superfamily protein